MPDPSQGEDVLLTASIVASAASGNNIVTNLSDPTGAYWDGPATAIDHSSWPSGGASNLRLAASPYWDPQGDGIAAIAFTAANQRLYCTSTSGSGRPGTWSAPVQISQDGFYAADREDYGMTYDASDTLYITWSELRSGIDHLLLRLSTDGGRSFGPEIDLNPFLPWVPGQIFNPQIIRANDGGMLLSFYADYCASCPEIAHIAVLRSDDNGLTWSTRLDYAASGTVYSPRRQQLRFDQGGGGVLLTAVDAAGLKAWTSPDSGDTWGSPQLLSSSALVAGNRFVRGRPLAASIAPGSFAVAWVDIRSAGFDGAMTDVYVRTTTNNGATWSPELRIDPTGTTARSDLLALIGFEGVYTAAISDGGSSNSRSGQLWQTRFNAAGGAPASQQLLEPVPPVPPQAGYSTAAATDGGARALVAFSAGATSARPDVYVAVSTDRGKTFGTPTRASTSAPGTVNSVVSDLATNSAGAYSYLTHYTFRASDGLAELHFLRSLDGGASWAGEKLLDLGGGSWFSPVETSPYRQGNRLDSQISTTPAAPSYVSISSLGNDDLVRRWISTDAGLTFSAATSYSSGGPVVRWLRACAAWSGTAARTCQAYEDDSFSKVYFVCEGESQLTTAANTLYPGLGCQRQGTGLTVLAYSQYDPVTGHWRIRTRRHRLSPLPAGWQAEGPYITPSTIDCYDAHVAFSNADGVVVTTCQGTDLAIILSRSTDGGVTFSTPITVTGPLPLRYLSDGYQLLTDNPGSNVWITYPFQDGDSFGRAVVQSSDAGVTWGAPQQIDVGPWTDGFSSRWGQAYSDHAWEQDHSAAFPGRAILTWLGDRIETPATTLVTAYDATDLDLDGTPAATDCDDRNPAPIFPAAEVTNVLVTKNIGDYVRLSWDSQAATNPTVLYDVIGQSVSQLRSSGSFAGSECKLDNSGPYFIDVWPSVTVPGDAFLYLVRAETACGKATYGNSSIVPDPRDALDAAGPCP